MCKKLKTDRKYKLLSFLPSKFTFCTKLFFKTEDKCSGFNIESWSDSWSSSTNFKYFSAYLAFLLKDKGTITIVTKHINENYIGNVLHIGTKTFPLGFFFPTFIFICNGFVAEPQENSTYSLLFIKKIIYFKYFRDKLWIWPDCIILGNSSCLNLFLRAIWRYSKHCDL